MRHLQITIFGLAVIALGFSVWYYQKVKQPEERAGPVILSPIPQEPVTGDVKPFDVRDYGAAESEADALNAFFADVRDEVTEIIHRDETLVIRLGDLKTNDPYKRKLYDALTMATRLKVISPSFCDRLKKKWAATEDPAQKQKIIQSPEYIACFPAKW